MIDPKAITTYAQLNEDLILLALLHDVKKGFYVDVGANYPVIDSVTKIFYDKGWRGVNIEPVKGLYKQLVEQRPNDINVPYGAGSKDGKAVLREYTEMSGHSTFDDTQKKDHKQSLKYQDYTVQILPLKKILRDNDVKKIDFMKIDVEGFEYEVVAGNDWQTYRPTVVCIEANHMSRDWRPLLIEAKYKLFVADGLNEYYVATEEWARTEQFPERIIELQYHALKQHQAQSWEQDSKDLERLNQVISEQSKQLQGLNERVAELGVMASLSLKNRPFLSRLKRATYGLTADWVAYKRAKKR